MAEEPTRSRLGRGLAALIGDVGEAAIPAERSRGQRRVPTEFLRPNPRNPRRTFVEADLDDLVNSVREKGIIQPILVRNIPGMEDVFEISQVSVGGARRSGPLCTKCRSSSSKQAIKKRLKSQLSKTSNAPISMRLKKRWAMSS